MDPEAKICPELATLSLDDANHQPSPADLLPPELWELIFRHLSATELLPVRLTCHRWKNIVTHSPTLLEKFFVTLAGIFVDLSTVIPAANVYIRMCRITRPLESWWHEVAHRFVYLTLDDCELTLATLAEMLTQTPNLKRLRLDGISSLGGCCDVDVNFRLEKLEKLVIEWVSYDGILDLFEGRCPRLKTFKTYNIPKESSIIQFMKTIEGTLEYIALTPTGSLLEQISNLKRWKLKRIKFSNCRLDEDQLIEFCRRNPTIERVCIDCFSLTTQTIEQIGMQLPALRQLRVPVAGDGTTVATFLHSMKRLEYLSLIGERCRYQSLDFTGCECPNLVQLQTYDIPPVQHGLRQFFEKSNKIWYLTLDGSSFDRWSDLFEALEPLENLYELMLRDIKVYDDSDDDDGGLKNKLYSLKGLVLSLCNIPKNVLTRRICQCKQLEELWLAAIDSVDEEVMLTLISSLTKLKVLNISGCGSSSVTSKVLDECKSRGILFDMGSCINHVKRPRSIQK